MFKKWQKLTERSRIEMCKTRKKLGLSQKDLGKKVGVVQGTISAYETGKQIPDVQHLHKLEEFFGFSLETEEFRVAEIKSTDNKIDKLRPLVDYVSENGPEKAREHLELAIQILSV